MPTTPAIDIAHTLRSAGRPLTRTEIARQSGLAYNTVKKHLADVPDIGMQNVNGNLVYGLSDNRHDSGIELEWQGQALRTSGSTLKLDVLDMPDVVGTYEKVAARIPLALPTRLSEGIDPAEAAQAIADYAIFLATVAAKLKAQQDNPSWYSALGGDEGYFTEPN